MIVLSESTEQIEPSASASENKLMTEAAQLLGLNLLVLVKFLHLNYGRNCKIFDQASLNHA